MTDHRRAGPVPKRSANAASHRRLSRMEIPPNQSSSARIATPKRLQAGHAGWGWLWAWLPGNARRPVVPATVEDRFSGDKIP